MSSLFRRKLRGPLLCSLFGGLPRSLLLCLPSGLFSNPLSSVLGRLRLQRCPLRSQLLRSLLRCQSRSLQLGLLRRSLRSQSLLGQLLRGLFRRHACRLLCFSLRCLLRCKLRGPASYLFCRSLRRLLRRSARCFFCSLARCRFRSSLCGLLRRRLLRCSLRCRFRSPACRVFCCHARCLLRCSLRSLLCCLARSFRRRFACLLLCCLTCRRFACFPRRLVGCIACRLLGCFKCRLLRRQFLNARLFGRPCLLGQTPHLRRAFHVCKIVDFRRLFRSRCLLRPRLLFVYRLLHAQPRLLPRLRPRRRKIAILGAVQIGPGIERRHIFRRLILVVQRSTFSHPTPQDLPLSPPISRSLQVSI